MVSLVSVPCCAQPVYSDAFQHICKALARISVAADPLPNRHAVCNSVRGCGDTMMQLLQEIDAGHGSNRPPERGTYWRLDAITSSSSVC